MYRSTFAGSHRSVYDAVWALPNAVVTSRPQRRCYMGSRDLVFLCHNNKQIIVIVKK